MPLSGSAAVAGNLVLTPGSLQFGTVPVGQSKALVFQISNTGGSKVTVTKSKPPGSDVGFSNTDDLSEGSSIDAGETKTLHVQFAPKTGGRGVGPLDDQRRRRPGGAHAGHDRDRRGRGRDEQGLQHGGRRHRALWPLMSLLPWALGRRRPG